MKSAQEMNSTAMTQHDKGIRPDHVVAPQVHDEVIIRMENVNKWFGPVQVLTDVNLTVRKGERIVVCGPSGSGKSTTCLLYTSPSPRDS